MSTHVVPFQRACLVSVTSIIQRATNLQSNITCNTFLGSLVIAEGRSVCMNMHVIITSFNSLTICTQSASFPHSTTGSPLRTSTALLKTGKMDSKDSKDNPTTKMATTPSPKADEGTPAHENKRIKLLQSEVDAAAAQEYYMTRLTEKQKLDMMEQGYQEQKAEIQHLKSHIAASADLRMKDCKSKETTALIILSLKTQLAASAEKKRKEDQQTKETVAKAAETYKQKVDAMERGSQEQRLETQELKSQIAAEKLKAREICNQFVAIAGRLKSDLETELNDTKRHLAESQKSNTALKTELEMTEWRLEESEKSITTLKSGSDEISRQLAESQETANAMKTELDEAEWELAESRKSCVVISDRSLKAQWETTNLKRALADKNKDSCPVRVDGCHLSADGRRVLGIMERGR
jgi:chromosome segregation ATPase